MRIIVLFLSFLPAISLARQYHSPVLELGPNHTYQSIQAAKVSVAARQAFNHSKLLMIKLSAAWCGPCVVLEDDFKAHPRWKAEIEKSYVFVEILDEFIQGPVDLTDFLPFEPNYYPSLYFYDPATGQWGMSGSNSAQGAYELSEIFRKDKSFAKGAKKNFYDLVNRGQNIFENDEEGLGLLFSYCRGLSVESLSAADFVNLIKYMRSHPGLFMQAGETEISDSVYFPIEGTLQVLIEKGLLTMAQSKTLLPEVFNNVESDIYIHNRFLFGSQIGHLYRNHGNLKAASECTRISNEIRDEYESDLSSPHATEWEYFQYSREVVCEMLAATTGKSTEQNIDDLVSRATSYPRGEYMKSTFSRAYVLLGLFDKAALLATEYLQELVDSHKKSLAEMEDELQKAIDDGDTDLADDWRYFIDVKKKSHLCQQKVWQSIIEAYKRGEIYAP